MRTAENTIGLRDHVMWFAQAMEAELRENDHKRGWSDMTPGEIGRRLKQEVDELVRAIRDGRDAEAVLSEAADVANFLMMLADNYVSAREATVGNGEGH